MVDIYQKTSVEITTWPGALFPFDDSAHGKVAIAFGRGTENGLDTGTPMPAGDSSGLTRGANMVRNKVGRRPNAVLQHKRNRGASFRRLRRGTISMIGGLTSYPRRHSLSKLLL